MDPITSAAAQGARSPRRRTARLLCRVLLVGVFAIFFFANPGTNAVAHPGNTADDGCHYCRTNCDDWGVPYDERHCHGGSGGGGGGGDTTTTSPPTTSPPPTTAPPSTSPPSTSAPPPTTTTVVESAPDAPSVEIQSGGDDDPRTEIRIEGDPGARFELVVESEVQRARGEIPKSGQTSVRLFVENGRHTATLTLADSEGNESEPKVETFRVAIPAPSKPEVSVTVVDASTVDVAVTSGPAFGVVNVDLGDEAVEIELSQRGRGERRVPLEPGNYEAEAIATDFQGQRSEPIQLAFTVDGDEDEGSVLGGFALLALLLAGGIYLWRRRRRRRPGTQEEEEALPADPPPPQVTPPQS